MKTAPFDIDRAGFEENLFELLAVREQSPQRTLSRRIPETDRAARPLLGGPSDEPSLQCQVRLQKMMAGSWHADLGFSDALRSLLISKRVGLSAKLCQRLAELLALQPGWDGESAKPPRPEVLAHVVGLLAFMNMTFLSFREPFLTPTIDGFAQLEWHNGQRTLEFEAIPNGWSIVGTQTMARSGKAYHEAEAARFEIERLMAAYRWFEGAELLWPIL